eukprot:scaffold1059_cov119-Isochrysis_galbana.AAC.4
MPCAPARVAAKASAPRRFRLRLPPAAQPQAGSRSGSITRSGPSPSPLTVHLFGHHTPHALPLQNGRRGCAGAGSDAGRWTVASPTTKASRRQPAANSQQPVEQEQVAALARAGRREAPILATRRINYIESARPGKYATPASRTPSVGLRRPLNNPTGH